MRDRPTPSLVVGNVRIAVAFTGDAEDRTARSGTPYGVLSGVRELGFDTTSFQATPGKQLDRAVAAVDAAVHVTKARIFRSENAPRSFKLAYQGSHLGRRTSLVRSAALSLRTRRQPVDLIVALGSGYETPARTPYVVYDDMTVAQAIRAGYPEWLNMTEADRKFRVEQQRRRYIGAAACCMTTTWAAESAHHDYGVPWERLRVVGAGTHEIRRRVERSWDTPRFLFVGLNWERKNGARVLGAFAGIRETYENARLDVVGGHPPIDQAGVTTWGRLSRADHTQRQKMQELFDTATCFVMPSLHEPGGVVFLEASAVGVSAIGGTNGGTVDFVGDAGVLVDPLDQDAIRAAMERFCDPSYARQMGERAWQRSLAFTWPQVAGRILRAGGLEIPQVIDL